MGALKKVVAAGAMPEVRRRPLGPTSAASAFFPSHDPF
jgi:hypothetical protein